MKKPVYSIEFSHIYADESFAESQYSSAKFLDEQKGIWNFEYTTITLIDDYNISEKKTEADDLLEELERIDLLPDFWAYEKDLIQLSDQLFDSIENKKIYTQYRKYIDTKGKYPCSFLTAAWYLMRLGYLNHQGIVKTTGAKDFAPSDRLINILASGFMDVEKKTLKLVGATRHHEAVHRIQDLFYDVDADLKKLTEAV